MSPIVFAEFCFFQFQVGRVDKDTVTQLLLTIPSKELDPNFIRMLGLKKVWLLISLGGR